MAGEQFGETWAVAQAAGPADVRVFIPGTVARSYKLGANPVMLFNSVDPSKVIVQNLDAALSIELGVGRDLSYGQGLRIPPNAALANGSVIPGPAGVLNVLDRFARAGLPAIGNPGRLVQLTDYDRGLWIDDGFAWASLGGQIIDVTRYDAVANGIANDTAAIRAAIAASAPGDVIRLPPAPCLVGGAAIVNQILLIPHPLHFIGSGYASELRVDAATPAGVDVFRIEPSGPTQNAMYKASDFRVTVTGGTPARHAFNFDISTAGRFLRRFTIQRVWTEQLGGKAIAFTNPIPNVDSFFTFWIDDNFFVGGIDLSNVGDDILIFNNTITGVGEIAISQLAGAGQLLLQNNSISIAGGVRIAGATAPRILHNQMEAQAAYSGANAAYLDLSGSAYSVGSPEIRGNLINTLAAAGAIDGIRLNVVDNAMIDDNIIVTGDAARFGIRVTANASKTRIGRKNVFSGAGGDVTDASTQTTWDSAPGYYSQIADSAAIANSAALSTFSKTYTLPADSVRVGDRIKIVAAGVYSSLGAGPGNITLQDRLAGTAFNSNTLALVAGQVNATWRLEAEVVIRSIGAGGTWRSVPGLWSILSNTTIGAAALLAGINTTIANAIDVQVQFTVANPANTITMHTLTVEIVRPGVTS